MIPFDNIAARMLLSGVVFGGEPECGRERGGDEEGDSLACGDQSSSGDVDKLLCFFPDGAFFREGSLSERAVVHHCL